LKTKIHPLWLIVAFTVAFALIRQCEGNNKVITKTSVNISEIIDSVKIATLKDVKTVYIDTTKAKIKWLKGETKTVYKDTIIYKDKPSETTVKAKQYQTEITSSKATAKLDITTTGELLDVKGVITYPEKETIKETNITRDASGFYIYGSMPISSQLTTPELGVMFQIKNKIIIGVGGQYNTINDNLSAVATIAIKL
jgi:hypothetical protein